MNNEIKEIEEWLRDISTPTGLSYSGDRTLSNSMVDHIIDCITNLKEENKRLSRTITDYDELLMQKNNVIDKAIEYCNLYTKLSAKDLLNILEGDKDE